MLHESRRESTSEDEFAIEDDDRASDGETDNLIPAPESRPRPRRDLLVTDKRRAFLIRSFALLCAMCLSVGSHYASYTLGPLKSRLAREFGASNTEFSLLISAYSLNSTWTPLLGGILASKFGTTYTSIMATGVILLGQILLLTGDIRGDLRQMALGMFVFGIGVSPLAVVQETIIVRFFRSHGLGVSMALGLVAGKGASFVSARSSYPLTQRYGPHAPFWVATGLAAMSFTINLVYIAASKWLVDGAGAELEAPDIREEAQRRSIHSLSEAQALEHVAAKRQVHFRDITRLGDVFWAYVGVNVLCGSIWSPFTHLASNIIEQRYDMTERDATSQASLLLAGSVLLYPICGYLVDRLKRTNIVLHLFFLSSCLTLFCYSWLALPASLTTTAFPGIAAFGLGHGFSTLLLVVIVPQLVPLKYVSTALGAHKSLEQTGTTIFQTFAGLTLDIKKHKDEEEVPGAPVKNLKGIQRLLNTFLFLNILQLLGVIGLAYLDCKQKKRLASAALARNRRSVSISFVDEQVPALAKADDDDDGRVGREGSQAIFATPSRSSSQDRLLGADLAESGGHARYQAASSVVGQPSVANREAKRIRQETRRGELFVILSAALILCAWLLFMITAWFRLRSKKERGLVPE